MVSMKLDRVPMASTICAVIGRLRRMLDELEVPQLGMVQVGEPAVDQAADEIERQAPPAGSRAAEARDRACGLPA